jgi:hypothetical protein
MGIIVEVTIQCVDNRDLEFKAYWCRLDDVLDKIDAMNAENDRVRIWWFPKPLLGIKYDVILSTMNTPGTPPGVLAQFDDMDGSPGKLTAGQQSAVRYRNDPEGTGSAGRPSQQAGSAESLHCQLR